MQSNSSAGYEPDLHVSYGEEFTAWWHEDSWSCGPTVVEATHWPCTSKYKSYLMQCLWFRKSGTGWFSVSRFRTGYMNQLLLIHQSPPLLAPSWWSKHFFTSMVILFQCQTVLFLPAGTKFVILTTVLWKLTDCQWLIIEFIIVCVYRVVENYHVSEWGVWNIHSHIIVQSLARSVKSSSWSS